MARAAGAKTTRKFYEGPSPEGVRIIGVDGQIFCSALKDANRTESECIEEPARGLPILSGEDGVA